MAVELREFVKQTLSDILKGVTDAQDDLSIAQHVAPRGARGGVSGALCEVELDVAVTAEAAEAAKGGAGFKVAVLNIGASAGGEMSAASKDVAATHVKFKVPLMLPNHRENELQRW